MARSRKTGRKLEPERGYKSPPWVRRFLARFRIGAADIGGGESSQPRSEDSADTDDEQSTEA